MMIGANGRPPAVAGRCPRGHTGPMNSPRIPRAGITVIGSGTASAAVDRVTISLAVEAVRAEPGDAFGNASDTATRLLSILADGGVDSRSVRTSDITLGPRIEYNNGRQQVLGYQAGQRLTVNREGLHGIERLLTDVASLGGDGVRIDGVSLTPGPSGGGHDTGQGRGICRRHRKGRAARDTGRAHPGQRSVDRRATRRRWARDP